MVRYCLLIFVFLSSVAAHAQEVIPLKNIGGLHSAYVVPNETFERVDVQLIVLSGDYDDPSPSGTAHFTEHLAAFSADATVLRQPRARDLNARTSSVASVYTNSGGPRNFDMMMQLSRALLDTPKLPEGFMETEIKIVQRETLLRERERPNSWLKRLALQNLYGSKKGRANDLINDLPDLNLDAAMKFHKEHYVASNVMVVISGKIDPKVAEKSIEKHFGGTKRSTPPEKWWLDEKPAPDLHVEKEISSNRLSADTLLYSKFVDPAGVDTSIEMQGSFFIASSIYHSRINKAFLFDSLEYQTVRVESYLAKNGDLEVVVLVIPMPEVEMKTARAKVDATFSEILQRPPTAQEIDTARKTNAASMNNASRRPASFLNFLKNVASDGLPPISPGVFAQLIEDTTDEEVLSFLTTFAAPSATSIVYATAED